MKKALLRVKSGSMQGKTHPLAGATTSVGRADDCDLVLGDYNLVSRHHAQFQFDGQVLTITDQNSTNGVLVNGQKVAYQVLKNGDRLEMGDFSATVQIGSEASSPAFASKLTAKWQTLPGSSLQKWGAVFGIAVVLFLGGVGMMRRQEPDPFVNSPDARRGNSIPPDASAADLPSEAVGAVPAGQLQPLAPAEPSNGKISAATIQGVKAATAMIAHPTRNGYSMGSAFALGDSRRIVTNRHTVVDDSGRVQDCILIFEPGTPRQRRVNVPASSISLAPDSGDKQAFQDDLAVITLNAGQTPALPAGRSEDLSETDEVYAVGFPLGTQTLTLNGDLPSASVKAARVERLQRDASNSVSVIQLGSSVTHGNSGGPVVNNRGEVVGVISSGVEGTGMAYAIPMVFVRSLP
ncbi:FHA domain-containing protein [bacterium]|nr:MAG: FHA domain-containing protein [bacterium]